MVGTHWHIHCIFHFPNYIQVSHGWFYHYNICTFFNIHQGFFNGFFSVGKIHLIGFLVAKTWGRIQCIPEWPIKAGSIFGTVCHDACFNKVVLFQTISYCSNSSIHHIARGHKICTSSCMADAHFYQCFHRFIIYNFAIFYNAIMAIRRIGIQCNIGHDHHFRNGIFNCLDASLHQSIHVPGFLARIVFYFIFCFHKKQYTFDAHAPQSFYFFDGFI